MYLDAARGVAVVAMVLAHVIDSWTREADRHREPYYTLIFVSGLASPLFLALAGLALAMSAAAATRRSGSHREGARAVRRRGWQIFGLGLLFRVQAQVLGFGALTNLLKVDILNIMGVAMVAAGWLWQLWPRRALRMATLLTAAVATTMITPVVRNAASLAALPDFLEAYVRPAASYSAFPWFPWAGFLFAGAVVGEIIEATRRASWRRQAATQAALAAVAVAGIWLAYLASFQPAIYAKVSFWHDSPTFFFIRLGFAVLVIPALWALGALLPSTVLQPIATMGRSSLFVYWIHIELIYGLIATPLKRALPLWLSLVATAAMTVALYALVGAKNRRWPLATDQKAMR